MLPSRTCRITSENFALASYVEYVIAIDFIVTSQTSLLRLFLGFPIMFSTPSARTSPPANRMRHKLCLVNDTKIGAQTDGSTTPTYLESRQGEVEGW